MPGTLIKTLKVAGAVLGAIVVLGLLFLSFADLSRYQPRIESIVSSVTGRDFRIGGEFELEVLPTIFVRMDDVTLANAPWSDGDNMLEVGHLSANVSLRSLLFGPVVIDGLEISDVSVVAEVNANDELNWAMDGEQATEDATEEDKSAKDELPVVLRNTNISNVNVVYRQPEADALTATLEVLNIQTSDEGHQEIDGAIRLEELPITFAGSAKDQALQIEATFGDVLLESTAKYEDSSVAVDLSVGPLNALGELLEVSDLPPETLNVVGTIEARSDTIHVDDFAATLGLASLTTKLALSGKQVTLDPFDLVIGESDIAGSLSYASSDSPAIKLNASSTLLDLSQFAEEPEPAEDPEPAEEPDTTEDGDEPDKFVFRDEPISTAALQGYSADVDLTVEHIRLASGGIENVVVAATVADGALEVSSNYQGDRGGKFEGELTIKTSGDRLDLTVAATALDLKLGLLSGEDIPDDLIPASNLSLDFTASGSTPRALASGVDGKIMLTQGPGRVSNSLISRMSGDIISRVFSALNPFSETDEFSNWECTILAMNFESGLGKVSGFLLQSEKLMIVASGEVELDSEELNFEFNTKPREGVGVTTGMFVTPFVAVTGTLSKPGVGLNSKGVLLSGGAAVLTGGMSFLYTGLADRASATSDRCEKTLATVLGNGEQD